MQLKNLAKSKKRGFTLVETIVAIGTIALVLPLVFAIFFVILQEQARFTALKQVKSEGESALYQIKNTIKTRAIKACTDATCSTECSDGSINVYFKDVDGNVFRFYIDNQKIASESISILGVRNFGYLTSDKITAEPIASLSGTLPYLTRCEIQGTEPLIDINFKVSFRTTTGETQYPSSMIYKTKVRLISY